MVKNYHVNNFNSSFKKRTQQHAPIKKPHGGGVYTMTKMLLKHPGPTPEFMDLNSSCNTSNFSFLLKCTPGSVVMTQVCGSLQPHGRPRLSFWNLASAWPSSGI